MLFVVIVCVAKLFKFGFISSPLHPKIDDRFDKGLFGWEAISMVILNDDYEMLRLDFVRCLNG
jgi:hypothetical protein